MTTTRRDGAWMGLVIPLVFPVFGYGLVKFGRHLASDEGKYLGDFLRETLDAREKRG